MRVFARKRSALHCKWLGESASPQYSDTNIPCSHTLLDIILCIVTTHYPRSIRSRIGSDITNNLASSSSLPTPPPSSYPPPLSLCSPPPSPQEKVILGISQWGKWPGSTLRRADRTHTSSSLPESPSSSVMASLRASHVSEAHFSSIQIEQCVFVYIYI